MPRAAEAVYQQLLVVRCQRGDRDAMEALVTHWDHRLLYYIRRLVDQEADAWDVLQKTWMRVLRGIGSLKDPDAFPCWLYKTARNIAIDEKRVRRDRSWQSDWLEAEEGLVGSDGGVDFEDVEAVHNALRKLSPAHRDVLTLFFLEDLSVEEIGLVVDAPQGTVKSRLHYARRALRRILEEEESR